MQHALRFLSLATAFSLVACSGGFGTMDSIMSSWVGAPLEQAIDQWGYPTSEQKIAGHHLYHWKETKTTHIPAVTTGTISDTGSAAGYVTSTTTGGNTQHWHCVRTLEVNKKAIIINSQWDGNNCPFAEAMKYANWRRKNSDVKSDQRGGKQ